jgi:hypothetical protein
MAILFRRHKNHYLRLHANCPTFLPVFNQIWIISTDFGDIPTSDFTKMHPVRASSDTCEQADRQMDRYDEANKHFSRFMQTPLKIKAINKILIRCIFKQF